MVTKLTALALATMLPVFLVNSIVLVLNESMEHTLQGVATQGQARLAAIHGAHDSFLTWDGQANMWVGLGAGSANSTLGLQTLSLNPRADLSNASPGAKTRRIEPIERRSIRQNQFRPT